MAETDNIVDTIPTIIRRRDYFVVRTTGALVPYNIQSKNAYLKNPSKFELPINYRYSGGDIIETEYPKAKVSISFQRVDKKRDYIIQEKGGLRRKTFVYGSEEELNDKVMDYIRELNDDYQEDAVYESGLTNASSTEWWVSRTLQIIRNINPYGYMENYADNPLSLEFDNAGFLAESEDEAQEAPPPETHNDFFDFGELAFNGEVIRYELPFLEPMVENESRCCWNYLMRVCGISCKTLMKITNKSYSVDENHLENTKKMVSISHHITTFLMRRKVRGSTKSP